MTSASISTPTSAPEPQSVELEPDGLNIVVLHGHLSSDPVERTLPSGDVLWSYEVTVREDGRPASSVPVVLVGGRPPARAVMGDPVAVVGRVRRRFFRAGGATASRTEVLAEEVVVLRRAGQLGRVLTRAIGQVDGARATSR